MSAKVSLFAVALLALLSTSSFAALAQPQNSTSQSCGADGQVHCSFGPPCANGLVVWNDERCHPPNANCGAQDQTSCRNGSSCLEGLSVDSSGTCRAASSSCQGPNCGNGGCSGSNCGGCSGPNCGGGNCQECPPSCPGQNGGGGGQDPSKPSLDIAQEPNAHGPQELVAGLANDVTLVASNPMKVAFTGAADLGGQPGVVNVTHFNLTLPPGGKQSFAVRIVPPLTQQGLGLSDRIMGTAGGVAVCTQSGFGGQLTMPVSIEWLSPVPDAGLATVQSLESANGASGGELLAFGTASALRVRATNVANATSAEFYLAPRVNGAMIGDSTPVPPLAPGASIELGLGTLPPKPSDCGGPVSKPGCFGASRIEIVESGRADSNGQGALALTIHAARGVVTASQVVALTLSAPTKVLPLVEGAATAELGKPYAVTLNVTNYGSKADVNDPFSVVFVPPFRAKFDVQGEESTTMLLTTQPGETIRRSAVFTPMISGRWEIIVRFIPPGEICCVRNTFSVDVPADVDVSVPTSSTAIAELGATARTPILVRPAVPLHDATLRVTIAPAASGHEGGGGDPGASLVKGGLQGSIVTADPWTVPLGDLAAGASLWSNVTVASRASGVYDVVPYVVAGGFAYTGHPTDQSNDRGVQVRPEFTPDYEVAFEMHHAPLAFSFAPVALVLVAGVGAFVGRRVWLK